MTKKIALVTGAGNGVKVTAICPGMVATDMVTKDRDFPAEKMIQVSDIVKTVDYLLSLGDTAVPVEIVVSCLPFIELTTTLRDRTEITFTVIEEKNGSDLDDFSDAGIRRSLLGKIVER